MAVPKLRFKADDRSEFPEWEKKKLSDVFVERREMQCIDDEYKLLSFTIEQGVINPEDKKTNKRDFLMKDKASKKFLRTEYNDIVYNPANLKYGAINRNKLGKGLLSPIYAIFYTDQNAVFMEFVVRNPDFIKRTLKYLEGTVVKLMTLKPRDFLRMETYIPCSSEQQKSADFLSTIDTVIEKQKETVSAWEERKKGVMQKLFSQEVRFKVDDGSEFPDWEEKKISDICKTFSGGTPKSGEARYYENGTISFIRSGEIHDDKTELRITNDGLNESSAKMVDIGDILYALYGATSGEVDISKIKGAINQAILCIRPLNDFNRKFIVEILRHNKETILRTYLQGGQGNLSAQIIQSLVFDFPCLAEQQKIADCLSSVDEVIEKQKATLSTWKELKKGLLQQMFV